MRVTTKAPAEYTQDFRLPYWLEAEAQRADSLAMQARAARLAGDFATARRLDAEFDAIYDGLEAAAGLEAALKSGAQVLAELQAELAKDSEHGNVKFISV